MLTETDPVTLSDQEIFVREYLEDLRVNTLGFRFIFQVFTFLFGITVAIQVIGLMLFLGNPDFGLIAIIQLIFLILYVILIARFFGLCARFAGLQIKKIDYDLRSQLNFRKETVKTSEEILSAAKRKVGHRVTSSGDNAVIMIGDGSISNVKQSKTVQGSPELIDLLALIISYTEEAGSAKATDAAQEFATEATKPDPDRGRMATLWATIAASVPSILSVVKIAEGVKALF